MYVGCFIGHSSSATRNKKSRANANTVQIGEKKVKVVHLHFLHFLLLILPKEFDFTTDDKKMGNNGNKCFSCKNSQKVFEILSLNDFNLSSLVQNVQKVIFLSFEKTKTKNILLDWDGEHYLFLFGVIVTCECKETLFSISGLLFHSETTRQKTYFLVELLKITLQFDFLLLDLVFQQI